MKLKLDNQFRIEGDLNSFTLIFEHPSIGKTGRHIGKDVMSREDWHYPTISLCLESYLSRVAGSMEAISVGDILTKYSELLAKIGGMKEFTWSEQNSEIVRLKEEIKELKKQNT